MSQEGMKDAILRQMEKNLAAAMARGDKREEERLRIAIENFEKENAHIRRGNSNVRGGESR